MRKNKSLLNILKQKEIGIEKIIEGTGVPTGSCGTSSGYFYFSKEQVESILKAVPSTLPYDFSPKSVDDLTPEQVKFCWGLNTPKYKGIPITIYDISRIIRNAQAYA